MERRETGAHSSVSLEKHRSNKTHVVRKNIHSLSNTMEQPPCEELVTQRIERKEENTTAKSSTPPQSARSKKNMKENPSPTRRRIEVKRKDVSISKVGYKTRDRCCFKCVHFCFHYVYTENCKMLTLTFVAIYSLSIIFSS